MVAWSTPNTELNVKDVLQKCQAIVEELQKLADRMGNERIANLVENVARKLRQLEMVPESCWTREEFKPSKQYIPEYTALLEDIQSTLSPYATLESRLHRSFNGDVLGKAIAEMGHRLQDLESQYPDMTKLYDIVQRSVETQEAERLSKRDMFTYARCPDPPRYFTGRREELTSLLQLLTRPSPRMAILGSFGVGKTTLALGLLHCTPTHYPDCLFVKCEEHATRFELLTAIANTLCLPSNRRGQELEMNIFQRLRARRWLICLDHLDTAWGADTMGTENLLEELASIGSLGLIITMRGTELPKKVDWTHPLPPPLLPLSAHDTMELFQKIAQCHERAQDCLAESDGVPLAAVLIAQAVNRIGAERFLSDWRSQALRVFDRGLGRDDRLTSLTTSIEMSLRDPRLASCDDVQTVLRLFSLLPKGISTDLMNRWFQPETPSRASIDALVLTGLVSLRHGRYSISSLTVKYIETIPLTDDDKTLLKSGLLDFILCAERTEDVIEVQALLASVHDSVVDIATWQANQALAYGKYLWWADYIGGEPDLSVAEKILARSGDAQITLRLQISRIHRKAGRLAEAKETLASTFRAELARVQDSKCMQALFHLKGGDLFLHLEKYDSARSRFKQGVVLGLNAGRSRIAVGARGERCFCKGCVSSTTLNPSELVLVAGAAAVVGGPAGVLLALGGIAIGTAVFNSSRPSPSPHDTLYPPPDCLPKTDVSLRLLAQNLIGLGIADLKLWEKAREIAQTTFLGKLCSVVTDERRDSAERSLLRALHVAEDYVQDNASKLDLEVEAHAHLALLYNEDGRDPRVANTHLLKCIQLYEKRGALESLQ